MIRLRPALAIYASGRAVRPSVPQRGMRDPRRRASRTRLSVRAAARGRRRSLRSGAAAPAARPRRASAPARPWGEQRLDVLGPGDGQFGIEWIDAVLPLGRVCLRAEIDHGRVVAQGEEAVAEAFREIHRVVVPVVEADDLPLLVGRGTDPDVDDDVQDGAAYALDVLGLAGWHIGEVKTAQGPSAGHRAVRLDQAEVLVRGRTEIRAAEPLVEAAAVVGEHLRLVDPGAFDGQRSHAVLLSHCKVMPVFSLQGDAGRCRRLLSGGAT